MVKAVKVGDLHVFNPRCCKERKQLSMQGLSVGHDANVHDVQTTTITLPTSFVINCCNLLMSDDDYSASNISKLRQLITNDIGAFAGRGEFDLWTATTGNNVRARQVLKPRRAGGTPAAGRTRRGGWSAVVSASDRWCSGRVPAWSSDERVSIARCTENINGASSTVNSTGLPGGLKKINSKSDKFTFSRPRQEQY